MKSGESPNWHLLTQGLIPTGLTHFGEEGFSEDQATALNGLSDSSSPHLPFVEG